MSLGTWFRDYVYFPMGGSRVKSKLKLIFNLLVVWTLTGIWHGASWNFLMWGLFYFVLLAIEKLTGFPEKYPKSWVRNLYWIPTMLFVMLGWVLFRAPDLSHQLYAKHNGLFNNPLSSTDAVFCGRITDFILIVILFSFPVVKRLVKPLKDYVLYNKISKVLTPLLYGALLFITCAYIVNSTYNPFIYFNF